MGHDVMIREKKKKKWVLRLHKLRTSGLTEFPWKTQFQGGTSAEPAATLIAGL